MSELYVEAAGHCLDLARGRGLADLLLRNVRLVNVLSGEIHPVDVAIADGVFLGFGDYPAREVIECAGRYLVPGLIEGHIHLESSQILPAEFARLVAARGTAAVVADPHEIANVMGVAGVEFMLEASAGLPVSFYFMVPSCVPATSMETAGAVIDAKAVAALLAKHPDRLLGLAEVMNFPGVINRDPETMAKIAAAQGKKIDGHAPELSGFALNSYIMAGPASDHEATTPAEAREKLRLGMHLMLREGSREHNLDDLLPVVNVHNSANCSLVSDDRHVIDLLHKGHLDYSIRKAIAGGLAPLTAIQMATINPARYFGLKRRGAVAPGYRADCVLLDDLENFTIKQVFLAGRRVVDEAFTVTAKTLPGNTVSLGPLSEKSFALPASGSRVKVIGIVAGQLVTRKIVLRPKCSDGLVVSDPERDLAKLAVLERHHGSGRIGLGLVQGLGLKRGALAGSVAHDSHNLIVAGVNDADMLLAVRVVKEMGGGLAVVADGRIRGRLPLPVAGLMSAEKAETTAAALALLQEQAALLGAVNEPFMTLSFLALPVIPALKLSDQGLVDVDKFCLTDFWEE
ncbi:MAG: adenine deaminase [Deltaproteobacteria bacterium]|nr:adenine deaminase [Deltaproteobacteria bacterium]